MVLDPILNSPFPRITKINIMAPSFKALHFYTAPFSGCSARIRIVAHLKSIPLTYHNIDFPAFKQLSPSYLAINPNGSVPSLIVETSSKEKLIIT
jgi:maleylacetoacetate isomerase